MTKPATRFSLVLSHSLLACVRRASCAGGAGGENTRGGVRGAVEPVGVGVCVCGGGGGGEGGAGAATHYELEVGHRGAHEHAHKHLGNLQRGDDLCPTRLVAAGREKVVKVH